jgi:UDP-glucuronate decarboxylase
VDDPRQRRPDIAKAREALGWQPRIDLREGLRRTIDYFDACLSARETHEPDLLVAAQ